MIGKVSRGGKVGGLLRYLFGPGRANEHTDPHLIAGWDDPSGLEPSATETGALDFRRLTSLLEQPISAAPRPPSKPVWHCSLRTAPTDRRLTDAEWAEVASEVLARTGYTARDDDGGCRWVAVRHADDHIHLVVTLARQDGRRVSTSNDFYRVGEACRWAEERFGLTVTAARDRTATRRPTRAENEKSARAQRAEPPRVRLQREVRVAAAGAGGQADFLARLTSAGLLVRPRFSQRDADQITGYSVALPGDRTADGQPIWFGGAKLAADLSWTKLARRWVDDTTPLGDRQRVEGSARTGAWTRATRAATDGADTIRRLAVTDPGAAADAAYATGDALAATARVVEGRQGGRLTDAAAAYQRAGRELWGRTPPRTISGDGLRAAARLLALTGRANRDESVQLLHLVTQLIALSEAVAALRDVQGRATQAAAAREAASTLRTVAPPRHGGDVVQHSRPTPTCTRTTSATRSL